MGSTAVHVPRLLAVVEGLSGDAKTPGITTLLSFAKNSQQFALTRDFPWWDRGGEQILSGFPLSMQKKGLFRANPAEIKALEWERSKVEMTLKEIHK